MGKPKTKNDHLRARINELRAAEVNCLVEELKYRGKKESAKQERERVEKELKK
jgi:hypothetical protein